MQHKSSSAHPKLRITGWRPALLKVSHTLFLREHFGLSLSEARKVTDQVLDGEPVELSLQQPGDIRGIARRLTTLGVVVELDDGRLSAPFSEQSDRVPEVVVDCSAAFTEEAFWNAYVAAVKPRQPEKFGRNLDALWDALEGGGPGAPTSARVVFANTDALAKIQAGAFLSALREIGRDCVRVEVVVL